jgi:DNA-binding beta-propeller fold protein YncE
VGESLVVKPGCIRGAIFVMAVCLSAPPGWAAKVCRTGTAKSIGQRQESRLTFVREFSSAEVFHRAHPVVDRTLDIVAGAAVPVSFDDVLHLPYAVTAGPGHRVFVTDLLSRKVHVFDFRHSRYFRLRDGDRLRRPVGLAADRKGNVYVADSELRSILVFDAGGKFRHYLNKTQGGESYFEAPRGLTIDPASGRIYVCDSPRHMVIVLDKKGHVLDHFGKRGGGTGAGEFRNPTQVAVAGSELFVLDTGNRRVQRLDLEGHFLGEVKIPETERPTGLAVDNDGRIYISDTVLNRVQVYSRDGRFLSSLGQMGDKAGEFDGPSGLWLDEGERLYVVDTRNKRVQLFRLGRQDSRRDGGGVECAQGDN